MSCRQCLAAVGKQIGVNRGDSDRSSTRPGAANKQVVGRQRDQPIHLFRGGRFHRSPRHLNSDMAPALVNVKIEPIAAGVWIVHSGRVKRIGVEQLRVRTTRKHRFASRVVDGHSVGDGVVKAALKSNGRAGLKSAVCTTATNGKPPDRSWSQRACNRRRT